MNLNLLLLTSVKVQDFQINERRDTRGNKERKRVRKLEREERERESRVAIYICTFF